MSMTVQCLSKERWDAQTSASFQAKAQSMKEFEHAGCFFAIRGTVDNPIILGWDYPEDRDRVPVIVTFIGRCPSDILAYDSCTYIREDSISSAWATIKEVL